MEQRRASLVILGRTQAILGAILAAVVFVLYRYNIDALKNMGISSSILVGTMGAAAAAYYLTLHQLIKRASLGFSTVVITMLWAAALILLIATTGGLDSPYYSFWLLAIVASGIFGTRYTVITLLITTGYFSYAWWQKAFEQTFLTGHIGQLLVSVAAGALAEWVYHRSRQAGATEAKFETLTGQLTSEQLKAQALMESIPEGIVVVNKDRQIQLINKAAQTLTGWDAASAATINYKLVMKLKNPDDSEMAENEDPFAQAWTQGTTITRTNIVMLTKAGKKIPLSLSVSPIYDSNKTISGGIALFHDITAEKAVERQRNEFISTASHEMRTPVAAIEGYVSLALNPKTASVDERAKGYLEKAYQNIEHMGKLFKDLLSITHIEDSSWVGHLEAVNLTELVQDTVADTQFSTNKKNLRLDFSAPGVAASAKNLLPIYWVKGNSERLREVLANLIENALKFTAEGSVNVAIAGNEEIVTVSVTDTGVGIPPEDLPHLFQKFYRVDNSDTRTIGGTGLGLYLCRVIVELQSGRIWAESTPGKGSIFSFSLPRISQQEAEALAAQEKPAAPVAGITPSAASVPAAPQAGQPATFPVTTPAVVPDISNAMPQATATPISLNSKV